MIDKVFKALSEESRLRILSILMEREMCVCEIVVFLNMSQSNASRHLTELKKCGILDSHKEAQWAYYRISDQFIQNNKGLWEYLQVHLIQLKTYPEDYSQYEKYKENDVCAHIEPVRLPFINKESKNNRRE